MIQLPQPLHPMVVHFPVALLITALVFEMISLVLKQDTFHKAAVYMYVAAALTAPLVFRTGVWEAQRLGLNHPLLDQHRQYAMWTMWMSLMSLPVLWFIQREFQKYFRIVLIVFLLLTAVLVTLTGDKGGRMVYEYGVGTSI